ncbi:hypothetical protein QH494_26250 [Sphingomonas sp. AR_OL41]|uniref:hypothetical protein n=1 Tax=Sphingomonas sp. AR_OL41 TaxID=3042729 RepID=UPI0024808ECA|nr:hypothetical protein [Sphingomonas sp. AR_OL41]MDH7975703.1 hypothetical protein [Sphingomonas sp. AR_OL41]
MTSITPIVGWLLDRVVEIDSYCPGFAGHLLRASRERRHVVAAYLAVDAPHLAFESVATLGAFITTARHDDIQRAAFEHVPEGYRGAISRGGAQIYPRSHYRYLFRLMSGSSRPATKRVIPMLSRVNPTRLRVARVLSEELQIAPVVMALKSVEAARDLNALVELLTEAGADRSAMIEALESLGDMGDVRKFAQRWAFRVRLPHHPVPATDGYQPIDDAAQLRSTALQYRNCMRNYVGNALEGRSAFAVVAGETAEAIVHIVRENGVWLLDAFYSRDNISPNRALVDHWTAYLGSHGILARDDRRRSVRRWASLRRLAGHFDYEEGYGA